MSDLPTRWGEPVWGAFGPMLPESMNIEDRREPGSHEGDEADRAASAAALRLMLDVRRRGLRTNPVSTVERKAPIPIQLFGSLAPGAQ